MTELLLEGAAGRRRGSCLPVGPGSQVPPRRLPSVGGLEARPSGKKLGERSVKLPLGKKLGDWSFAPRVTVAGEGDRCG